MKLELRDQNYALTHQLHLEYLYFKDDQGKVTNLSIVTEDISAAATASTPSILILKTTLLQPSVSAILQYTLIVNKAGRNLADNTDYIITRQAVSIPISVVNDDSKLTSTEHLQGEKSSSSTTVAAVSSFASFLFVLLL